MNSNEKTRVNLKSSRAHTSIYTVTTDVIDGAPWLVNIDEKLKCIQPKNQKSESAWTNIPLINRNAWGIHIGRSICFEICFNDSTRSRLDERYKKIIWVKFENNYWLISPGAVRGYVKKRSVVLSFFLEYNREYIVLGVKTTRIVLFLFVKKGSCKISRQLTVFREK